MDDDITSSLRRLSGATSSAWLLLCVVESVGLSVPCSYITQPDFLQAALCFMASWFALVLYRMKRSNKEIASIHYTAFALWQWSLTYCFTVSFDFRPYGDEDSVCTYLSVRHSCSQS